jgi:nucleoside-diphosphate-sugar epimerase
MIYAKDLARAVLACLENGKAPGNEYLLEDGRPHTWSEVTAAIGQSLHTSPVRVRVPLVALKLAGAIIGGAARCMRTPALVDSDRLKDFLQPSWTCSSAKVREDLGFVPQYTLDQGIAETTRWYTENNWL